MLADVIEPIITVGRAPKPAFVPVVADALLGAGRSVPEGHDDVTAFHPFPVGRILWVPRCTYPVLTATVAPVKDRPLWVLI